MSTYLPDTNVLIDFGRSSAVRTKLENAVRRGLRFVIAPPTMTELTVGVIKGGEIYFDQNREIFAWVQTRLDDILDLPRPFMGKILEAPSKLSQVGPHHHAQRIDLVVNSKSFDDFLKRKGELGSFWKDIDKADSIHRDHLDREFDWLENFAKLLTTPDLAAILSKTFGETGAHPDATRFREHFSAALEYMEASITKIRNGANPRKNDRGRYGDSQLFFYLADPEIRLLTQENFAGDIKLSPQRSRIVGLDSLG